MSRVDALMFFNLFPTRRLRAISSFGTHLSLSPRCPCCLFPLAGRLKLKPRTRNQTGAPESGFCPKVLCGIILDGTSTGPAVQEYLFDVDGGPKKLMRIRCAPGFVRPLGCPEVQATESILVCVDQRPETSALEWILLNQNHKLARPYTLRVRNRTGYSRLLFLQ